MKNALAAIGEGPVSTLACRPGLTVAVTRGVCRFLIGSGYAPLTEFSLANGRRADIAAIGRTGQIVIVEVKSCQEDYAVDQKWTDYVGFCDQFYFAVNQDFPTEILPSGHGLILADDYGGAIMRAAPQMQLSPARRKAVMIRLARQALLRRLPDTSEAASRS